MSLVNLTSSDLDLAAASPEAQRASHRTFHQKIAERAAALIPAPPVVEATPAPAPEAPKKEWARPVIREVVPSGLESIRVIQRAVCDFYKLSFNALISQRRKAYEVHARQVAMYLCRELTPHSFPRIGQHFGDRDHTTVLHATRKIEALIRQSSEMGCDTAFEVASLFEAITGTQQ